VVLAEPRPVVTYRTLLVPPEVLPACLAIYLVMAVHTAAAVLAVLAEVLPLVRPAR
jgi:hypothetical protein